VTAGAHREVELKLLVPPEDVERLRRHPRLRALSEGRPVTRALESRYFDTPSLDLARAGAALRLRRVGRLTIQTVKLRGSGQAGLFSRGEWECPVAGTQPDLSLVPDTELRARLARAVDGRPLAPIVVTSVRRTERRLRIGAQEIALALDVGEVRAGGKALPICELELELLQGEPATLYALALGLHESIPLRPALEDKARRGFAQLLGEGPTPERAQRPALESDASFDDALAAVFASCLDQILANEAAASAGVDPEGVHQMRVGIRRLRSALALLHAVSPAAPLERLREDLRWLAAELGGARDLDVFCDDILGPVVRARPDDPALKRLAEVAREVRQEQYDALRRALASRRYTHLALDLGRWLATRGWRDQALTPESARLFAPAREVAADLLARRYRKVRRAGRRLEQRSPEEKHALRIQLKKLRYAAEFFGGLFAEPHSGKMVKRLARLQDVLGHLNDQATADRLLDVVLERLGAEAGAGHQRSAGLVAGWTGRAAWEQLEALDRRWKRLLAVAPFWTVAG
jgi:triphosphatase